MTRPTTRGAGVLLALVEATGIAGAIPIGSEEGIGGGKDVVEERRSSDEHCDRDRRRRRAPKASPARLDRDRQACGAKTHNHHNPFHGADMAKESSPGHRA